MILNELVHTQLHKHVALNIFLDNWAINPGAKFNNHTSMAAFPTTFVILSTGTLISLIYNWSSVLHYSITRQQ